MDNESLAYEPPVMKEDGTAGFAAVIGFFILGVGNLFFEGVDRISVMLPIMSAVMFCILFFHFRRESKVFKEEVAKYNYAYDKRLSDVGDKKLREMVKLGAFNDVTKDRILSFLSGFDSKRAL